MAVIVVLDVDATPQPEEMQAMLSARCKMPEDRIYMPFGNWPPPVGQRGKSILLVTRDEAHMQDVARRDGIPIEDVVRWSELFDPAAKSPLCPPPAPTALQRQVGGDHYTSMPIQPMELAMRNNLNACQATAIKYLMRYKAKGGVEDLRKARHTIDLLIQLEYGE